MITASDTPIATIGTREEEVREAGRANARFRDEGGPNATRANVSEEQKVGLGRRRSYRLVPVTQS